MGGEVFWGDWGFLGEGLRGNPSTACGGPPPLEGRLLRAGMFWGWNGGLLGRGEPLHHLAAVPLP